MARQSVQQAALGVVQRLSLAHETKGAQILGVACGDGYENRDGFWRRRTATRRAIRGKRADFNFLPRLAALANQRGMQDRISAKFALQSLVEVCFAAPEDHDAAPLGGKHAGCAVREASQEFGQVARLCGVNGQLHQFFGTVAVTWRSPNGSAAARASLRWIRAGFGSRHGYGRNEAFASPSRFLPPTTPPT